MPESNGVYAPIGPSDRVLITGARGMLGRRLAPRVSALEPAALFTPARAELDLLDRTATIAWFVEHRPTVVIMLAARVGGIQANISAPYEFLAENLYINLHTFDAAMQAGCRKILFLGSSCIYPRAAAQPMTEESLLTGPLEPTNEGYALAKIAGIRMGQYLGRTRPVGVVNLMPPNLYGPGDTFDLARSHVVSALVKRFVDARRAEAPTVTLFGTGSARREFLHVDDIADGIVFADRHVTASDHLNLGTGQDISIRELAELIRGLTGYEGAIAWDATKGDGMPQKLMDSARMTALGFRPTRSFRDGLRELIAEYSEQSGADRR